MIKIIAQNETQVTQIKCPKCLSKLGYVGLLPNAVIHGMAFKCRKCGSYWSVTAKRNKNKKPIAEGGETRSSKIDGKERDADEKR